MLKPRKIQIRGATAVFDLDDYCKLAIGYPKSYDVRKSNYTAKSFKVGI